MKPSKVISFPSGYEALLAQFTREHQPRNTVEHALVQIMARQRTLARRFASQRHRIAAERGFQQALAALLEEKQRDA